MLNMTIIFCLIYCTNCPFCTNSVLCTTTWLACLHAKILYVRCGWMNAKYNVLRLSTDKLYLTCLTEDKVRYILLLMCLTWCFHLRCSFSKIHKNIVDCSVNYEHILCNLVLFISIFSPVNSQWECWYMSLV